MVGCKGVRFKGLLDHLLHILHNRFARRLILRARQFHPGLEASVRHDHRVDRETHNTLDRFDVSRRQSKCTITLLAAIRCCLGNMQAIRRQEKQNTHKPSKCRPLPCPPWTSKCQTQVEFLRKEFVILYSTSIDLSGKVDRSNLKQCRR